MVVLTTCRTPEPERKASRILGRTVSARSLRFSVLHHAWHVVHRSATLRTVSSDGASSSSASEQGCKGCLRQVHEALTGVAVAFEHPTELLDEGVLGQMDSWQKVPPRAPGVGEGSQAHRQLRSRLARLGQGLCTKVQAGLHLEAVRQREEREYSVGTQFLRVRVGLLW